MSDVRRLDAICNVKSLRNIVVSFGSLRTGRFHQAQTGSGWENPRRHLPASICIVYRYRFCSCKRKHERSFHSNLHDGGFNFRTVCWSHCPSLPELLFCCVAAYRNSLRPNSDLRNCSTIPTIWSLAMGAHAAISCLVDWLASLVWWWITFIRSCAVLDYASLNSLFRPAQPTERRTMTCTGGRLASFFAVDSQLSVPRDV